MTTAIFVLGHSMRRHWPHFNYSRAIEISIDATAGTAKEVWEYRGTDNNEFFTPFYGDADWLPHTGNFWVSDGGHIEMKDGTPIDSPPGARQWGRIFELSQPYSNPEKVFELTVKSDNGFDEGWCIYRAKRISSLDEFHRTLRAEDHQHGLPTVLAAWPDLSRESRNAILEQLNGGVK